MAVSAIVHVAKAPGRRLLGHRKSSRLSPSRITPIRLRSISVWLVAIFELSTVHVEAHLVGDSIPVLVESVHILGMHTLKVVKVALVAADALLDNLTALTIEHALMGCFLDTLCLILVHLLTVNYLVAATNGSVGLRLVNVVADLMIRLLDEVASLQTRAADIRVKATRHLFHHFVDAAKHIIMTSIEERIVLKGITEGLQQTTSSETFEHFFMNFVHAFDHVASMRFHFIVQLLDRSALRRTKVGYGSVAAIMVHVLTRSTPMLRHSDCLRARATGLPSSIWLHHF